jgi:uncharacterized protein YcbX
MTPDVQPSSTSAQGTTLHAFTDFEAQIAALWVFPIKSCAGISVPQAVLTPTGLAHDRAWMVVDAEGEMVTQRELPRMALIQPELVYEGEALVELVLHASGMAALHVPIKRPMSHPGGAEAQTRVQVQVWDDQVPAFDIGAQASAWLSAFLGDSLGALRLVRFDDTHHRPSSVKWTQGQTSSNQFSDGFPVLVSSVASLQELNTRLLAKGEAAVDMRRFRVNVVLGNAEGQADIVLPHDEDRIGQITIHTPADALGEAVQLLPVKPCPRCPIPNINPDTAQSHHAVSDTLQAYRQDARVNGALTFGMNCLPVAGIGQVLRVGQSVTADWVF